MKLTTNLYLLLRRMSGAIPHSPNTSSWHGALLSNGYIFKASYIVKHKDNFTLPYLIYYSTVYLAEQFHPYHNACSS
jgi:hypothetical protein